MSKPAFRKACNLCHSQKVACQRNGSNSCARCIKANIPCTSSVSMRNRTRRGLVRRKPVEISSYMTEVQESRPSYLSSDSPLQLDIDWDDIENAMVSEWFEDSPIQASPKQSALMSSAGSNVEKISGFHSFSPNLTIEIGAKQAVSEDAFPALYNLTDRFFAQSEHTSMSPKDSRMDLRGQPDGQEIFSLQHESPPQLNPVGEQWVRKLIDINLALFKHCATLPLLQKRVVASNDQYCHAPDPETKDAVESLNGEHKFAIDDTFQLSRQLIDLLKVLDPKSRPASAPLLKQRSQSPPDMIHQQWRDTSASATPRTSPSPAAALDSGSCVLVLSCYLRLLDIYAKLFGSIHTSFHQTQFLNNIRLPELNVGSFSLHPNSTLQLTLILQLAEVLLHQLRDAVDLLDQTAASPKHGESEHPNWPISALDGVVETSLQTIRIREAMIVKRLQKLKRDLQRS